MTKIPRDTLWEMNAVNFLAYSLPWADLPGGSMVKDLPAMWVTQVPPLGREDPLEKGMTTQYSCLEILADRGVWWAAIHGITKSWTFLPWEFDIYQCFPSFMSWNTRLPHDFNQYSGGI